MERKGQFMKTKVLFATSNKAKVVRMRKLIKDLDIELLSLEDIGLNFPEPEETGANGEENARIKAAYYFEKIDGKFPVLSQDDTMHLLGVADSDNPGKDIKQPVIDKYGSATDENIIIYYTDLAKKYGGKIKSEFRYGHALATKRELFSGNSILAASIVSKPDQNIAPGYPISRITIMPLGEKDKYWSEMTDEERVSQDQDLAQSIKKLFKHILYPRSGRG